MILMKIKFIKNLCLHLDNKKTKTKKSCFTFVLHGVEGILIFCKYMKKERKKKKSTFKLEIGD